MPDLADLYPGFASHWIDTAAGRIFARSGGKGPPLLLLHGYPQTNVMWHRVAPALAAHFSLIVPDLPPWRPRRLSARARPPRAARADRRARHRADLGHVAPHGRPPRHARLALDVPRAAGAVPGDHDRQGGALLFRHARRGRNQDQESLGLRSARARPLPRLLRRSGAHPRDLRRLSRRPHTDLAHDEETRASGQKITCPLLAIWGAAGGIPAETEGPLATWREWAINVRGFALDCGHYLAEEAPDATAKV